MGHGSAPVESRNEAMVGRLWNTVPQKLKYFSLNIAIFLTSQGVLLHIKDCTDSKGVYGRPIVYNVHLSSINIYS